MTTALVLPAVDLAWGQPESVPGLVNTPGYEDGAEVSPDGQWLLVTDYSPMDMISCALTNGGFTPANPACVTVVGPTTSPLRPSMPGGYRVAPTSSSFINSCPSICYTSNNDADGGERTDVVLPPVSAYLFQRAADGSFANPTSVAFAADGCAHVMGLSFVSNTATQASVLFAFDGPWGPGGHRVQHAELDLGAVNVLGRYECTGPYSSVLSESRVTAITGYESLGNPNARGGFLWIDDEHSGDLRFWQVTGSFPGVTLSGQKNVADPPSDPADRRTMPFFHAPSSDLYYSRGNHALEARTLTGADPSVSADWGTPTTVVTADTSTATGAVFAVGEPSIADLPGAGRELYFIYAVKTATGVNMNLGRVRKN